MKFKLNSFIFSKDFEVNISVFIPNYLKYSKYLERILLFPPFELGLCIIPTDFISTFFPI